MPKAAGRSWRIIFSGSKRLLLSIRTARLTIRTRSPWRSKYSAMVVRPIGYISKTGVLGTRSLTGPYRIDSFRKSYTLGACRSTRSAILNSQFPIHKDEPGMQTGAAHGASLLRLHPRSGHRCTVQDLLDDGAWIDVADTGRRADDQA